MQLVSRATITVLCSVCVAILGCGKSQSTSIVNTQESERSQPVATVENSTGHFELLPTSLTGIDFQNRVIADHPDRRLYHSGFVCGGVAIGDIDGDQLPDVFLANGPDSNKLYKNLGGFRFKDISVESRVNSHPSLWSAGVVMVDIDNDRDLDIYVCNYDAPNLLYINDGSGRFVEAAAQWKLDVVDACLTATFQDYDRDGDLDVYLLNNRYYRKGGRPAKPPFAMRNGKPQVLPEYQKYYQLVEKTPGDYNIDDYGRPDRFLKNNGNSFEEVTDTVGIAGTGYGLSATWWDYDSDGWPDLYVCNDFNDPDRLYHNNRDGTFTESLLQVVPHSPWFSMGSDAGDLNNDGLVDFFCVDMSATTHFKQKTTMGAMSAARLAEVAGPPPQYMRNAMYLNTGHGRCMEVAYLAGLADSDWSWSAKLADFDHDGRLDVFISNGMVRSFNNSDVPFETNMLIGRTRWDLYEHLPTRPEQNLVFANQGDLKFQDKSEPWGLAHVGMSYGTALADLDGDHDLDMVVVNVDEPISIYRNGVPTHRGLKVQLEGVESNRFGIGAKVELRSDTGTQVRYLNPASGFLSCNEPVVHFGLGKGQPQRLTIDWPSGTQQVITEGLTTSKPIIVREARSGTPPEKPSSPTWFVESPRINFVHKENDFDDFAVQPLLPNRLSQLGPGVAVADIDQDGDEDLFMGGSAGQPGAVLFGDGAGNFVPRTIPEFVADAAHEDMGALFFDVDRDGDEDLYVVSGGVEAHTQPELLHDRLYINDSKGGFAKASVDSLPKLSISGSVVAANDFDRDGDLDLFIGGRMIPGQYPLSPGSRLLRNEDGKLVDATAKSASSLLECGMVSSAVWSDINSDGWDDLVVVGEWGPVRVFENRSGELVERTDATSTQEIVGWFNGIAARDLDGDQDIDLVVTNSGLNTKYHTSIEQPALLYYGDFENTGRMRLVEAEFEDESLFPIRGKSCSTNAMPFLADKFESYHDFALADLGQLYTDECLAASHRFAATELQSGVFMNEGEFQFRFHPLPRLAQASPGLGVTLTEINGDSIPDLYLVQNFHGPQPETGNMDGGVSLMLKGIGNGQFQPVWPAESGLVVPGDASCLATLDANRDGHEDFFVGVNQGNPQCFLRNSAEPTNTVRVRLLGPIGNARAIGSRVTLHLSNGSTQTAECIAGGGYLSQSSPTLTFGTANSTVARIEVEWPDGNVTYHEGHAEDRLYEIEFIPARK